MKTKSVNAGKWVMLIVLLSCAFAASAVEKQRSNDWANWRGPDHNRISRERNWASEFPEGGPKILWRASIGIGFSSVSVAGGRAYTMGNIDATDIVWCFDAETGKEIWRHTYPCPLDARNYEGGTHATPTVDGQRVYTFSKRGHLFCLDVTKGEVVWSKDVLKDYGVAKPTWGFASSPLIQGDLLILNAGSAGMAFKKATGELVWKSGTGPAGYATPVPFELHGEKCLAIFGEKSLVGVRVSDGKELWRAPWRTKYEVNAANPIISGDKIFISSGYNRGCAVLKIGGGSARTVWENRNMRNHFNSCVLYKGHLYGFDETQLKCLDFKTGAVKWSQRRLGKGSVMIADEKLIVMSDRGELVIAKPSPDGFKAISRAQVLTRKCWTVPVLSGGRIYCRNAFGDLVCVDVAKDKN